MRSSAATGVQGEVNFRILLYAVRPPFAERRKEWAVHPSSDAPSTVYEVGIAGVNLPFQPPSVALCMLHPKIYTPYMYSVSH